MLCDLASRILDRMPTRVRRWAQDPAKITVVTGWASRLTVAMVQFIAIRILTQLLGIEGYGGFAIVTGLLAWFLMADLGFGSSLQNLIAVRRVAGKSFDDAIYTTATFLTAVTTAIVMVIGLCSPWVGPWLLASVRNITGREAGLAFFSFGALASGTASANLILKVYFGLHRGYVAHTISASAALIGLALLGSIAWLNPDAKLAWSIIAFYFPGWLIPSVVIVHYLWGNRRMNEHYGYAIDTEVLRTLAISARWFLLFSALGALTLNFDFIILSRTVEAGEVSSYSVYSKVYILVVALFGSMISAYWPLSSELILEKKFFELRNLIRRIVMFGALILSCVSLTLLIFRDTVADLLSPNTTLSLNVWLIPAFTIYILLRIWAETYSMVILSAGRAWVQCTIMPVQAAISLGLGYYASLHYGSTGLVFAIAVSYLATTVWFLPFYVETKIIQGSSIS